MALLSQVLMNGIIGSCDFGGDRVSDNLTYQDLVLLPGTPSEGQLGNYIRACSLALRSVSIWHNQTNTVTKLCDEFLVFKIRCLLPALRNSPSQIQDASLLSSTHVGRMDVRCLWS